MSFEPLVLRLSLIRLGTLMVIAMALLSLVLTLAGVDADTALGPILGLAGLTLALIGLAYATVTLRIDTVGLWLNSPFGERHTSWAAIEAVRVTGQRPFLGVGLTLKTPAPARKNGIDQQLGVFWGLPNEELLGILRECLAVTRSVAQ